MITRYAELNFLIPRVHLHSRGRRPEAFGRAALRAGDPKRLAELPLLIVHFGMGVLHCPWFDFMAIDCLFCYDYQPRLKGHICFIIYCLK